MPRTEAHSEKLLRTEIVIEKEVTFTAKKIKVRILPKVSGFHYQGHTYRPGDELEVSPGEFKAYIMEKVEPLPKKEEAAPSPAPEELSAPPEPSNKETKGSKESKGGK